MGVVADGIRAPGVRLAEALIRTRDGVMESVESSDPRRRRGVRGGSGMAVVVAVLGCDTAEDTKAGFAITNPSLRTAILSNIPTNSDKRCVGIAIVAEALLDGICVEENGSEDVEKIAQQIYGNLVAGRPLRHRRQIAIDGVPVPITAKEAMDIMSTLVADYYKRDYARLLKTDKGVQRLRAAQSKFVVSSDALDRILDADPDKMDAFFGAGCRVFPHGAVEDTYHVVLIGKKSNGETVLYDANDPGSPIDCAASTPTGVPISASFLLEKSHP